MNSYEMAARDKKVEAICHVLLKAGATSQAVRSMTLESWGWAAKLANVKPPSAITRSAVVAELEKREGTR